jgi:hypothetical protein
MQPKKHLVWSKENINLEDPFQKKWYIQQVLLYGRMEDIQSLDLSEVEKFLPELSLPEEVRRFWEKYFYAQR